MSGAVDLEQAEVDALAGAWTAAFTDGAGFAACCSAGVSYEDPLAVEPLVGLDPLERHAGALRSAFPDARVERTAAALRRGSHACIPWRLLGTHRGDLGQALPATDRFLSLHGLHYLELSDGRISRARGFFDLYDGSVQLGLLPARGGFGEAALLLLRGFGLRRQAG
ncbi:MAG: ester cyclase [Actinomycetota bacterium]|nr:ester cyclase [Actinomycetota bacterium]